MLLPERYDPGNEYRYGFNGMEKDDEVSGEGNSYDFGARLYNPRIGRWFSTDAHESKYPSISPYAFAINSVLRFIDPDGNSIVDQIKVEKRSDSHLHVSGSITIKMTIVNMTGKALKVPISELETQASKAFSGSVMGSNTMHLDENGNHNPEGQYTTITGNIKVNFEITEVTSIDEIKDASDHVMLVVDKLINDNSDEDVAGRAEKPGEIGAIEGGLNKEQFEEVFIHETGHNLGLDHTSNGGGALGANVNGSTTINSSERNTIVKEVLDARYSEKYRKDNNINVSNKSDNKSKSKEFKKNNVADD